MKKLLATLLLAIALLTVSAAAAENSMENFIRGRGGRVYDDQFSDLPQDSVFYENVAALYEYGLTVGKGDGTFGVKENVTVSQIVIFAGRIRSLYAFGDAEKGASAFQTEVSGPACVPYLDYLKAEKVLGNELDEGLFAPATRGQMAYILANILPEEALPRTNDAIITEAYAAGKFIPDVTEETPYQQDILTLYHCGISHGSDDVGTFHPDDPITRGAVAAMLTRVADPTLRITFEWKPRVVPDVSAVTYGALVEPGEYYPSPQTDDELASSVRYMLSNELSHLSFHDSDLTIPQARETMIRALEIVKSYCEQSYNFAKTELTEDSMTIRFTAGNFSAEEVAHFREEALAAAKSVHDTLWRAGTIHAEMTEREKALVYYAWIAANCSYDMVVEGTSLSHLPYSVFYNGLAVCDGYTGAYNLLLKLEGIRCTSARTEKHIWTVATLDGTEYHIDTTWGDAGDGGRTAFFAMTPEASWRVHTDEV